MKTVLTLSETADSNSVYLLKFKKISCLLSFVHLDGIISQMHISFTGRLNKLTKHQETNFLLFLLPPVFLAKHKWNKHLLQKDHQQCIA